MATDVTPDDGLLARLRSVARVADPVPEHVVMAGRSAIAYRDLDVRLAELVEENAGVGVRGEEEPWFSFEFDDVVIEITIRCRDRGRTIIGQVGGASVTSVLVDQPDHEHRCTIDELGRFSATVETGPVRVRIALGGGEQITTSWVVAS